MKCWILVSLALTGCGARSELPVAGSATSTGSSTTTSTSTSTTTTTTMSAPGHVVSVALGYNHGCALLDDGTAWCWGDDSSGQLGNGAMMAAQSTPIPLASPTGIAAMAGGLDQTCAVLHDGTLECWGGNGVGESGTGIGGSSVPPTVIAAGFAAVSAGFDYSCGARTDGTAACWGYGDHGQLGNMAFSSFDEPVPTTVVGAVGAVAISASEYVTCVRTQGGGAQCWGLGPLGDGTTSDSTSPVPVQGLTGPVTQLAVGGMHACALLGGGSVQCWGYGGYGELGLGTGVASVVVATAVPGLAPAVAVSSGEYHTCALLADGTAQCWGNDTAAQKGSFSPVPVPGLAHATAIASGQNHDCALLETGKVVCWGANDVGQLGDGTTTPSATPVEVLELP